MKPAYMACSMGRKNRHVPIMQCGRKQPDIYYILHDGKRGRFGMNEKIKQIVSDYKVTYIVLLLWAVFGSAEDVIYEVVFKQWFEMSYEALLLLDAVWRFLLLFAIGCFLAETCFGQSRKRKLLTMGNCFLLSAVIVFLGFVESAEDRYGIGNFLTEKFTEEIFVRAKEWMAAYMILILCAALFVNYRRSGKTFLRYMGKVVFRMAAVCGGICVVLLAVALELLAASMVLLSVREKLFQDDYFIWVVWRNFNLYMAGFTVLAGGVYALQEKEESPDGEENSLYSKPVCMTNDGLSQKSFYRRAMNVLPWLLLPLSVLQGISLSMRIVESGLTRKSYLGILLVLFEVIALVMWLICRKHMEYLLAVVAGFTVVAVFVPIINMTSLCCMQQEFWLKTYSGQTANGEELSEKEAARLQGAYQYLVKTKGSNYVWEKYGSAESLQVKEDAEKFKERKHYRIHGCQMVGDLNVDGFCEMRMLMQDPAYTEQKAVDTYDSAIDVDFENFRFEIRETGEMVTLDISSIYEAALTYILENPNGTKESANEYLKGINCMETKDGSLFYLNHFEVDWYEEETEEGIAYRINDMQISGMLVVK